MPDREARRYGQPRSGDVYVEVRVIGTYAKATAIDATTGIEASVVGPASASIDLQKLAAKRLERLIAKTVGKG